MAIENFLVAATGCVGVKTASLTDSYSQSSAYAEINCVTTTLEIGDTADVVMGYDTDNATVITGGYVKNIVYRKPEMDRVVTIYDPLIRANDYFMASDDPEVPFTADNISAEALVVQLLALAGITGVSTEATGFTFGVTKPVPINLTSVWDAVENIARICGFVCYADPSGAIHFKSRKPYIVLGDVSAHTFETGNGKDILDIEYTKSDERLRNAIAVYGAPGIHTFLGASSPYVIPGFFKTLVVAHELIDTQVESDRTATVNLAMFNRLTETCAITALGNPNLRCRSIVDVSEAFTGLVPGASNEWFVFGTKHTIDRAGYNTKFTLSR